MGHSRGYRSGTRYMFKRSFGEQGRFPLAQYLKTYRVGDYVDVVANGAVHKGMPHKYYHGRTGVIFNVSKRALGVEVNKVVRNRIEKKRINVRVEHARPSKCRQDFLDRVKRNEDIKRAAKKAGKKAPIEQIKRVPKQPKGAFLVTVDDAAAPSMIHAIAFDEML